MRVFDIMGINGPTTSQASTDTAAALTGSLIYDSTRAKYAREVLLVVESKDIRIGLGGSTPTTGGLGGFILYAGDAIRITGEDNVRNVKIVSKTAGQAATVWVTAGF